MSAPLKIGPVPFDEAIAAAKARGLVLPDEYYGVLRGVERANSFSVAGIASLDQLDLILGSLVEVLDTGASFEQWKRDILKSEAALALPNHRLDNIFRTNIQAAYARGRCVHVAKHRDSRPFLMYSAINDSRTRPAHMGMNGYVGPVDDPVWLQWTPPNGYRCRCSLISLTEEQADKRRADDHKQISGDADAAKSRQDAVVNGPDAGWDYSPCDGLKLPPGIKAPAPDQAPNPALQALSPGIVQAIKRERHPVLKPRADALLVAFLTMLAEAIASGNEQVEQ